jgi:ribosome-associated translation inhibitor RaiA
MRLVIRQRGVNITEELRTYLKDRLRLGLGRFARRIDGVRVYLRDMSGPHGSRGKKCRIVVEMPPRGRVIITEVDADILAAIAGAANRAGFAVKRHLNRRRAERRPPRRLVSKS